MIQRVSALWVALLGVVLVAGCGRMEARSLAQEGNALYRKGDLPGALSRFQQAARLDPDFSLLFLHMGYTHLGLSTTLAPPASEKHAASAAAAFKQFMALEPDDERGPRFYLQVLLDSGRLSEATAFLKAQHRKNPRDVQVVSSLGVVASRTGKFDEALSWYEKRAKLLPKEARARYLIGTLCWKQLYKNTGVSGAERIKIADRGLAALSEALKIQPDYAEAVTYSNLLYRERALGHGDDKLKEQDMARARKLHRRALAMIKAKAKKAKQAEKPSTTGAGGAPQPKAGP